MAKAEEWKPISGFYGFYEVSSHGRVRSLERMVYANHPCGRVIGQPIKAKILKPIADRDGYMRVNLYRDGKSQSGMVHRFVCRAFHGENPEGRTHVAHGDGSRANNHFMNLRWATPQENSDDMTKHGTVRKGGGHPRAKLAFTDVQQIIKRRHGGETYTSIATSYGVSISTISSIIYGKNWVEAING